MKKVSLQNICLLLTLLLATTFLAGCSSKAPVTQTDISSTTVSVPDPVIIGTDQNDPYEITKDQNGKDIVILVPEDDGNITMEVAESTTLETFLACVRPKEGYILQLTDKTGSPVTDTAAVLTSGMIFEVVKDGETQPEIAIAIRVIAQSAIEDKVEEQQKVESQLLQQSSTNTGSEAGNPDGSESTGSKVSSGSSLPATPVATVKIHLSTVWNSKYSDTSALGKAWQATLDTAEKHKGISTTVSTLDANTAADLIVKETMAGNASADIYEVSLAMCRNIAKNKAAVNLFESKTLNRSLIDNGGTDSVTFNNKCYGVALNGAAGNATGIIYNKNLVEKYAPEYDLQALYKAKKWNFDAFRTVAKLCTVDTNGDGQTDIFGVTSNTNIIGQAITSNAGGTALMKNGRVEATMCNSEGIAALEWCKELFRTDKSWKYYADIKDSVTAFCSGNIAMFASNVEHYPTIASNADFEYDLVHVPMGSDQDEYIDAVYNTALYVVSKSKANRLDDVGKWINSVSTISSKLANIEAQKLARHGFSNEAIAIYRFTMNNMQADYSTGAFTGAISGEVDSSVTNAAKSPAKVMAAIRKPAQKELDDFYANMY